MWPLAVLAAVFISGCSLFGDDKKSPSSNTQGTPSAPPPAPPPQTDTVYRRACLTDTACPPSEKEAALYDFIGAVYGEKGRTEFLSAGGASVLSASERSYVSGKFGFFNPGLDTAAYLAQARSKFIKDLNFPPDPACRLEPPSSPLKFQHPELGMAVVLGGRHGCGKQYADAFMKSGVELSMGAESAPWAFFLEGYGTEISKKVKLEEMELFGRMAETLHIPLLNPLPYAASSLAVRKEASKGSEYTPEDFAVAMVYQVAATEALQNPGIPFPVVFEEVNKKMAPVLEMKPEDLFEKTRLFLRKFPSMNDQQQESNKRIMRLAETSNRMSRTELIQTLQNRAKTTKNPMSLFVVGANHAELIRSIYEAGK
ncbi:MAG: hypothetical protein U1F57_05290 [bacterium]